jgi:hypothetical protein
MTTGQGYKESATGKPSLGTRARILGKNFIRNKPICLCHSCTLFIYSTQYLTTLLHSNLLQSTTSLVHFRAHQNTLEHATGT